MVLRGNVLSRGEKEIEKAFYTHVRTLSLQGFQRRDGDLSVELEGTRAISPHVRLSKARKIRWYSSVGPTLYK